MTSLMSLTKAELDRKAAEAGIAGRSTMSHDDLADALADAASTRGKPS
ncbi:hypothetical protein [Streptomyces sp. KS 21]|nr:hypothetical protein [Streptomyces sp. KS 21]